MGGENGSGPPVISFCGSNTPGLINAAGPYPEPCAPYMGGSSNNAHMMGYLIPGENEGTSLSERVRDIASNPGMYYFNFHSIASWGIGLRKARPTLSQWACAVALCRPHTGVLDS